MGKKKALGRGLDALITMESNETQGSSFISEVEIEKIKPNPDQPRTNFDDETMEELATSIKKIGVITTCYTTRVGRWYISNYCR